MTTNRRLMEPKTIIKRSYYAPYLPLEPEGLRFSFSLSILKLLQFEIIFFVTSHCYYYLAFVASHFVHRLYRLSSAHPDLTSGEVHPFIALPYLAFTTLCN